MVVGMTRELDQLRPWETADGCASASRVECGAGLRMYFPALAGEMDGPALEPAGGNG